MLAFLNSIKFVAMLNKYLYLEDFIYKFDRWIFSRIYFIQQDYQDHFYGPLYIMELGEAIKYYVLITYQALLTNLFSVKVEQTRNHKAIW